MDHDSKQCESLWRLVRPPLIRTPPAQAGVRAAPSTALAPAHRLLMSVVYGNESAAEIISPEGLADSPSDAAKPLQLTHATPIQGHAAAEEKCPLVGSASENPGIHRFLRGFPNWKRSRMTFSVAKASQRTHAGGALVRLPDANCGG